MNVVSLSPPAWTGGLHKVTPRQAPVNTAGQECCPHSSRGNSLNLAGSLLSGMALLCKGSYFQGSFTGVILQETILGNCTGSGCLKTPEEIVWFLHYTAKCLAWCWCCHIGNVNLQWYQNPHKRTVNPIGRKGKMLIRLLDSVLCLSAYLRGHQD